MSCPLSFFTQHTTLKWPQKNTEDSWLLRIGIFRNLRLCPLVSSFTVLWLNFYHTLANLSMFVHTQVCGGGPPCYRQQQPSNAKPSLDPSQRHCCCCCAQSMCSPRFHPLAQLSYIKQLLGCVCVSAVISRAVAITRGCF